VKSAQVKAFWTITTHPSLFEAMEFIYGASSAKALEQHKKYKRILHPFGFDPFGFMTL
jgi:hypothetical protein